MTAGPNSFAIARFGDEPLIQTELPNLNLALAVATRVRAACAQPPEVRKRPPASTEADGPQDLPPLEDASPADRSMWHATQHRACVRPLAGSVWGEQVVQQLASMPL